MLAWRRACFSVCKSPVPAPPYSVFQRATTPFCTAANGMQQGVFLTDRAVTKLQSLERENNGIPIALRLKVDTGGCAGFQYEFSLEKNIKLQPDEGEKPSKNSDLMITQRGAKLVIDKISLDFLSGCQIDFKEEMIASTFQVVANKSAASPCSCGKSFELRA